MILRTYVSLLCRTLVYTCLTRVSSCALLSGPDDNGEEYKQSKPRITAQPKDQPGTPGGSVTFSISASRAESYQWKRNGSDIPEATGNQYTLSGITDADTANRYTCVVSNSSGIVTSQEAAVVFGINYPFPTKAFYAAGIAPDPVNISTQRIQNLYEEWKENMYVENPEQTMARIKFDDEEYTVSEGIAYGLLIMVYMESRKNDTRDEFNRLWNYYSNFTNRHGLMDWKIKGFEEAEGHNGATDADLDAAMALLLAWKQWGDTDYYNAALSLIENIRDYEVDASGHLKPGDVWNDAKNPSYLSTAALRIFSIIEPQQSAFWTDVLNNSYTLLSDAQHQNSGLVPDWCNTSGVPTTMDGEILTGEVLFGHDAVRTPWRTTWDYLWFGERRARDFNLKIAEWVKDVSASHELEEFSTEDLNLSGTSLKGDYINTLYVSAWAYSAMCSEEYSSMLNDMYSECVNGRSADKDINRYFQGTLLIINSVTLSGHLWNPWR
ncbi:MAG: glycosyl hydrolase family 8 [Chitinivibrionales bacterium]